MIFGTKPVYIFAAYNKKKMHSLGRAYSFDQCPVDIGQCPIKIVENKAEIFFPGSIFNTYVLSVEDKKTILKSYDDKLTFTKTKLDKAILHTVKIITEDERSREVALYSFDEFFPGYKSQGTIEYKNDKPMFRCELGSGPIVLQSNEIKKEATAVLAQLDSGGAIFAEVDSPVERAIVTVVKDLNNHKIVENGNIKGILIGARNKKPKEDVGVYVKNVYPGCYCFVEDIMPGVAEVQLIGRHGSVYKVKYKDFFGECEDRRVKKTMKGMIYGIKGNQFKFTQNLEEPVRSENFEAVSIPKRIKITDESKVMGDELHAINFIKNEIEQGKDPRKHFERYIQTLEKKDSLCLFYIQYLLDQKQLTEKIVEKIVKETSKEFPKMATDFIEDINLTRMIFKYSNTVAGFLKLLEAEKDKESLIKAYPKFTPEAIRYICDHLPTPRVLVERVIDSQLRSWLEYLNHESGNYKRGLFKRIIQMNFNSKAMKEIFKQWVSFEQSVGGDVEEVHRIAREYVSKKNSAVKSDD